MSESMQSQAQVDTTKAGRVLVFSLGQEKYALPLLKVREVIALTDITPVPFSPPHFKGIMNLRGQVISVIDLRLKMGQSKPAVTTETAIVILDLSPLSLGVIVDAVDQVLTVADNETQPPPEIKGRPESNSISAVIKKDKRLILLLDIARALSVDDLSAIRSNSAA